VAELAGGEAQDFPELATEEEEAGVAEFIGDLADAAGAFDELLGGCVDAAVNKPCTGGSPEGGAEEAVEIGRGELEVGGEIGGSAGGAAAQFHEMLEVGKLAGVRARWRGSFLWREPASRAVAKKPARAARRPAWA